MQWMNLNTILLSYTVGLHRNLLFVHFEGCVRLHRNNKVFLKLPKHTIHFIHSPSSESTEEDINARYIHLPSMLT